MALPVSLSCDHNGKYFKWSRKDKYDLSPSYSCDAFKACLCLFRHPALRDPGFPVGNAGVRASSGPAALYISFAACFLFPERVGKSDKAHSLHTGRIGDLPSSARFFNTLRGNGRTVYHPFKDRIRMQLLSSVFAPAPQRVFVKSAPKGGCPASTHQKPPLHSSPDHSV